MGPSNLVRSTTKAFCGTLLGMLGKSWLKISLARKISVLFGAAVLLTIGVTLAFPWLQMTFLDKQALLLQAKRVATSAYQAVDLHQPDWFHAQQRLDESWDYLASELDLPGTSPRLVTLNAFGQGFQSDAIERLKSHPDQRYYWRLQRDGRQFRFAMAIRATQVDPHPDALRGMIDVRLPVPQGQGFWNAVITVLAGASGAVLAILVFYFVTQRWVLSPVHSLRKVAQKVTEGDIEVRSTIQSGDEFQALSETFNGMLTHLKSAQEDQQKINRSLDVKLGELSEVNVALYESSRLKSEFLANVTHELRTPLVSIIGFAELVRDAVDGKVVNQNKLSRYAQNILSSGRNLLDLINDLLDLAKIEAGELELHLSEFFIGELCQDLVDFVQPLSDKRKQKLSLEAGNDLPECHSDSGRIKQILYNLLSNAIKFTPVKGSITLCVEREGQNHFRLRVQDNGPGIAKEDHEKIFKKFQQLDASETREYAGTGLGLAITKELAEKLGGTLSLETEVGEGSTFHVVLPVTLAESSSQPTVSNH